MSVMTQSIPTDLLAGIRSGDEQALEHGFREIFPVLLSEADAQLHDRSSASRVVERAFLQVLAMPPADDAAALSQAIDRALHQSIVREQSRLAALRRFEHNEGVSHHEERPAEEIGAAPAWRHILEARSRAAQPRVVDAREAQHHAAEHMAAAMKEGRRWSLPLLVLGFLALSAALYGVTRIDPRPSESFITGQLASTQAKTIGASAGRIGAVTLTDGSALRIAAGSVIKVVNNFGDPLRAISVQGAVSITVASAKRPLEIRARNVAVSAVDGQIDLRADARGPTVVRIVSGAPVLAVGDSAWTARAGEAFAIDGSTIRAASAGDLDEAFAWMDGRFVVSGTVRDVVDGIRRWYDVDVGLADNAIADWPASASGSLESVTSSIQSLEKSARVRMIWQDRHMLLVRR